MKRIVSAIILMAMIAGVLCGCVYLGGDVSIQENGVGTATFQIGVAEDVLKQMDAQSLAGASFQYNGRTYVGNTEEFVFANLAELNAMFDNLANSSEAGAIMSSGGIHFESVDNGLTLTIEDGVDKAAIYRTQLEALRDGVPIDALSADLANSIVATFRFTFPNAVYQVAGSASGVSIDENTVTLDLTKLGSYTKFSTVPHGTSVHGFTDVPYDAWYCNAVEAMAKAGLVNGVGEGSFAPERPITRAEIMQVIARAKGLAVGEADGHWAGQAVRSCVKAGYIVPGSVTRGDNIVYFGNGESVQLPGAWRYKLGTDVQASREEAIGILFRASKDSLTTDGDALCKEVYSQEFQSLANKLMPDYSTVNRGEDGYADEVALAFMTGMTNGVDAAHNMNPTATISRAEFCQILYNLGWAK